MPPKRKRLPVIRCGGRNDFEASSSTSNQASYRAGLLAVASRRRCVSSASSAVGGGVGVSTSLSPLYIDLGLCSYACQYCGAEFWFDERVKSVALRATQRYNGCCKGGKVVVEMPKEPPVLLRNLVLDSRFMVNIRAYNSMFSMTSFGANIEDNINRGQGPYVFKIAGQICHWLGSLCPSYGERPRFLQLYIFDPLNEVRNRLGYFRGDGDVDVDSGPQEDVVVALKNMLDVENRFVKLFRSARDYYMGSDIHEFVIRLYSRSGDRRYGLPTADTVGAIVSGGDLGSQEFDVVIYSKDGLPQRVSRLHPSYMPLQYPLLFPYGDFGWSPELRLRTAADASRKSMTNAMYYCFQLHERSGVYSHMLKCGRLLQQYIVDAYVCVEHCRLDFIRKNQNTFRSEFLSGIHDAVSRGDTEGRDVGRRVILPSSFTGGPRYMYKHYQDALALCRVFGNPQYFITFTCNANWPEIRRELLRVGCLLPNDRPDIVSRVFEMKVNAFIKYLKTAQPFGVVEAELYTIEFQKRGLPHCHTLIWVSPESRIHGPSDVDRFISAEIPDPVAEPVLHSVVTQYMLHGPCGLLGLGSVCMKDGKCSKKFPKPFTDSTFFDDSGYVHYRRAANGNSYLKNGVPIDNGFVVPYNKDLLLHFDAHINVEYCGWSMLVKYLFKYISKGVDRIRYSVVSIDSDAEPTTNGNSVIIDEVSNFVDARFICPYEAVWRTFGFPVQHRNPAVQLLAVHLENMQNVTFRENANLVEVQADEGRCSTTLTEWLANNRLESDFHFAGLENGLNLKYVDYINNYRWDLGSKKWLRRQINRTPSVSRLAYVHPSCGELFYLRLLLQHQVGCCSFADIRKVSGIVSATYRDACQKLGLIGDDSEWSMTIEDASLWASAKELRRLFAHLLLFCDICNPSDLWEKHWRKFTDDISYRLEADLGDARVTFTEYQIQQHVLLDIENILHSCSTPKSLADFNIPLPDMSSITPITNRLLLEEKSYDIQGLVNEHSQCLSMLNMEQLAIYDKVITANKDGKQLLLFIYGYGGTGKTFLWKTLAAALRSQGQIVLAVAASGIASLLLPAGRTAHSRFKLPLELTEESVCYVKKNTHLAELLLETNLIIWDEAPMSDRRSLESLDRTLRDLTGESGMFFGGKTVLLGGDFRQTLPVKPQASKNEIINSCLPSSYLWPYFCVYTLTENMRLKDSITHAVRQAELCEFSAWLLKIGDGDIGIPVANISSDAKLIQIPSRFIIPYSCNALSQLIDFVYGSSMFHQLDFHSFANRAIICPKNKFVHEINNIILSLITDDAISYLSSDSMVPHSQNSGDANALYPVEYLNTLNIPGIPDHNLLLKKNSPIMLMRNLDQKSGLCNGTRLLVSQLLPRVIEAYVITGIAVGNKVYIPRINFVHNDKKLPFVLTRRQFPVKLCYAMSINKSQGQSLKKIGLYLPEPVFTHGQLYVALSRATSPDSLRIVIKPNETQSTNNTLNIVYSDLLHSIQ